MIDEGVLVEIVRPGTGDPVAAGEVGEVVVTTLFNTDYPLIRFGTGDLSAVLPGMSACGRTNARIKGWLGRADQTTKVKGMFVHPSQVAAIAHRHPEIVKARLVVDNAEGADRMTLNVEVAGNRSSSADAIVESIREITKLRGEVAFRAPGELPERRQGHRRRAQVRLTRGARRAGFAQRRSAASPTNGLLRRSSPNVEVGPWPGTNRTSSPSGHSCSVIERTSSSKSPRGKSVRPIEP